jgi:hypothetical protein
MFLMKLLALSRGEDFFSTVAGAGAVVDVPVDETAFLVEGGVLYIFVL